MPITDDRTPNLNLPLPYADNLLEDDADRIRQSFTALDLAVAGKQPTLGFTAEDASKKGVANGYAGLDGSAKVPASQLPSYVDDVVEVANFAALPGTGEAGKIYVLDTAYTTGGYTCTQFRWSGSSYVPIPNSPGSTDAVPEGSTNLYYTAARALAAVPIATNTTLGKVKIGAGLGIDGTGLLFASAGGGSVMSFTEVAPATNGATSITVPGGYVVGAILVALNGSLLGPFDFTATDGTTIGFVGFTAGTTDAITIVNLATVSIGSLPAGSVGTTQLADGGATTAKIADGAVTTAKLGAIASINGGPMYGNRVINGAQEIDQINNGAAVTPASGTAYLTDMFGAILSQSSKLTFQQVTDAPAGFQNSMKISVASQYSPSAGDFFRFITAIEVKDVIDFKLGTSGAATFTLSNQIKGSVPGVYAICLTSQNSTRTYVATINVTTQWAPVSITVAGDTAGTWNIGNLSGLVIQWDLGSGSNFNAPSTNTWSSSIYLRTAGSVTFVNQVAGSTLNITGVDCRLGSAAPTYFERRANELQLAQRYYQVVTGPYSGYAAAANIARISIGLKVTMRAIPSIDKQVTGSGYVNSLSGNPAISAYSLNGYSTANVLSMDVTNAGGITAGQGVLCNISDLVTVGARLF